MIVADRVQETTAVTGTGTATLLGVVTGYQAFATAFPAASTAAIPYCITDSAGAWEVGLGTFNLAANSLTRVASASSNAGALVSFSAGTKQVFCAMPAQFENANAFTSNATPPTNPQPGQRWIDPTVGILYTWFYDGVNSQWVEF